MLGKSATETEKTDEWQEKRAWMVRRGNAFSEKVKELKQKQIRIIVAEEICI